MNNTKDFLLEIKKLLQHDSGWTKHEFARDYQNRSVYTKDPQAMCFCLAGAVAKVLPVNVGHVDLLSTLNESAAAVFPERVLPQTCAVVAVNDHRDTTHADILKVIDHALCGEHQS